MFWFLDVVEVAELFFVFVFRFFAVLAEEDCLLFVEAFGCVLLAVDFELAVFADFVVLVVEIGLLLSSDCFAFWIISAFLFCEALALLFLLIHSNFCLREDLIPFFSKTRFSN